MVNNFMKTKKITIYTDGAARGNPGKAGWGAVILYPYPASPLLRGRSKPICRTGREGVVELGGRSPYATNNQMELTAPIEALKSLSRFDLDNDAQIEIFSDSKYVILGITEWIFGWQKNNWRNAAKKPVLNKEFWQELFSFSQKFKIKWNYVAGHAGDKWNERADEIATGFADGLKVQLKKEK